MPNLQAVLDEGSFNGMDETLKTFYTQNSENKNYYLNVDGADKIAFNLQADLKKKEDLLKRAHDEKNDLKSKYTPFESLGKTAEEIKQALESNRPEEVSRLLTEKDEQHRLAIESFEKTISDASSKAEKYQQQLLQTAVDTHIAQVRNQYDLNDTAEYVLRNFYKAEESEDGKVSVRIYENGNLALIANQPKTDEQLLKGFREEKKFLSIFNAGSEGGTGGFNSQKQNFSGSKVIKRAEFDNLPHTERAAKMKDGYTIQD